MQIARHFTEADQSPYAGVRFRAASPDEFGADGFAAVAFPEDWSAEACQAFHHSCLRNSGVAAHLTYVPEDDVPTWLWRRIPDADTLAALPEDSRSGGETSARQVFDRIAGAWTYTGWKCGYFDREDDARAFYDEIRFMLCNRIAAPDGAQWRNTGLYWAYGIAPRTDGGYITDYRTGKVVRANAGHLPPHGAFIQGVSGELAGTGGIFDLWQREARLLGSGLETASNVSRIAAGGHGLLDQLRVGEAAAQAAPATANPGTSRLITIDADHAEACAFAESGIAEQQQRAALASGTGLLERQAAAIRDACRPTTGRKKTGRSRNPALRLAMHGARAAQIPEGYARDLARLAAEDNGDGFLALNGNGAVGTGFGTSAAVMAGRRTRRAVRMLDQHLAGAGSERTGAGRLLHRLAEAAWMSGGTGILFDSTANLWNTCKASGAVRSPAAGADFIFLDDSACGRASIDLAAFAGGGAARTPLFDTEGFSAAAGLWTVALDISVMNTAMPTMRLAARTWEFRPLGLGIDNLAGMLMSCGIAYDSVEGRAMCAAIMALMTGTAYVASAEMARELGRFPGFERNRDGMLRVIRRHRRAAKGRPPFEALRCPDATLERAVRRAWDRALELGEQGGFRNAQVTLVSGARDGAQLAGDDSAGIEPGAAVTRYQRLPGGGYRKTVNRSVPRALKALGYGSAQIDDILRHVLGYGTLESAPGINHESLRRRGFDSDALERMEAALPSALEIGMVFNRWILGEKFCTHMLGFRAGDIDDPAFDILAGLGFSNAGIEAANAHCCGADTLEGAPHLKDEHLAAFDGARRVGRRGTRRVSTEARIRMMAAAQPFVSGGVGSGITVPEAASVGDCKAAFRLAWRLGLKILMVQREGGGIEAWEVAAPAARTEYADASIATAEALVSGDLPESARAKGGFLIYDGGLATDDVVRRRATAHNRAKPNPAINRTCSDGGKEEPAAAAETSRRSSQDAARSAASVPSSADAVVEHRHS